MKVRCVIGRIFIKVLSAIGRLFIKVRSVIGKIFIKVRIIIQRRFLCIEHYGFKLLHYGFKLLLPVSCLMQPYSSGSCTHQVAVLIGPQFIKTHVTTFMYDGVSRHLD